MIFSWGGVTFLLGWRLPSHGRQGGLYVSYDPSLTSLALSPQQGRRLEHSTKEEPFRLSTEEGKFVLVDDKRRISCT